MMNQTSTVSPTHQIGFRSYGIWPADCLRNISVDIAIHIPDIAIEVIVGVLAV